MKLVYAIVHDEDSERATRKVQCHKAFQYRWIFKERKYNIDDRYRG